MLFNSVAFILFLPLVVAFYFLLPHRFRWVFMLIASYVFYGYWKVEYLALIAFSTVVDYSAARIIEETKSTGIKRAALLTSLATNIGLLFYFKYFGWFLEDVMLPANLIGDGPISYWNQHLKFILPVGISFYTFQTMGYTIDVFFGHAKAERNPLKFALFVSFFPQLVAGPIERFTQLHGQLFAPHKLIYENIRKGAQLMLIGLFIKMCVADNVSNLVDPIFDQYKTASSIDLAMGALLFGIQIFSDFHGYSLIAIGTAQLFGIRLMDNFNSPYSSLSIAEFWSRWHISLSTWFRDYLYIPLGGNRHGKLRWIMAILVVFIVSGLWHGANWTFVFWGAIHGAAYLLEQFALNKVNLQTKWWRGLRWIFTMSVVFLAWIFFRSNDLDQAFDYIKRMVDFSNGSLEIEANAVVLSFVGLFLLYDIKLRDKGYLDWLNSLTDFKRWSVYAFLIYSILAYSGTVNHPFIYFQF